MSRMIEMMRESAVPSHIMRAAAKGALHETCEQLARADMAAFETQGRFIKSRYGEQGIESEETSTT